MGVKGVTWVKKLMGDLEMKLLKVSNPKSYSIKFYKIYDGFHTKIQRIFQQLDHRSCLKTSLCERDKIFNIQVCIYKRDDEPVYFT